MQLSSQKRFVSGLIALALVAGLVWTAGLARADVPAGTLEIQDGNGFVNAEDAASGVPVHITAADGSDAVSATVWFETSEGDVPSGCGPFTGAPTRTGSLNATCAGNLPEGEFFFKGFWRDADANESAVVSTSSIKDTIPPDPASDVAISPDLVNSETQSAVTVSGEGESGTTAHIAFDDGDPETLPVEGSVAISSPFEAVFDVSGLSDGTLTATVTLTDPSGNSSEAATAQATKKAIAPEASIQIGDGSGVLRSADASTGVELTYEVAEDGPEVSVTLANDGEAAPEACTFGDLPRSGSVEASAACFEALADGTIVAVVTGSDEFGNVATATADATLSRLLSIALPGRTVNAEDVAGGLSVRFDIDPEVASTVTAVAVATDVQGNASSSEPKLIHAGSSAETRTLTIDVSGLDEGTLSVTGSIEDGEGVLDVAAAQTVLDVTPPVSTWITQDGDQFFRLWNPVSFITGGCCTFTSGQLEGRTDDLTSTVQYVQVRGRNLDTGAQFFRPARMSHRNAQSVTWTVDMAHMAPGEWELVAQAGDSAGNRESEKVIRIEVIGIF